MNVALLYFEACPNWKIAEQRLLSLAEKHPGVTVTCQLVDTIEEAERVGFRGSPSILVDGVDVFAEPGDGVGLSCRVYRTPAGPAGAPSLDQLRAALGIDPTKEQSR